MVNGFVVSRLGIKAERRIILECHIDDMDSNFFSLTIQSVIRSGAIDAWFTPVFGKKNRPAYQLNIILVQESQENVLNSLFSSSRTAGVRMKKLF